MASTFTEITTNTDLQNKDLHNEIRAAFNERQYVHTNTKVYSADVAAGDDIQAKAYWLDYQNNLKSLVSQFIDPTFVIDQSAGPSVYDLNDWYAAAGLTSGFRRVPGASWPADWTDYNDPAYSYGKIEAGDIIGPWLFVDLQKGLNALTRTYQQMQGWPDHTWTSATREGTGSDVDCQTALDAANTAWTNNSWNGSSIEAGVAISGDTDHDFIAYREKVKPKSKIYVLFAGNLLYDVVLYAAPIGTSGYNPDLKSTYGFTYDVWNDTGEGDTGQSAETWESTVYFGDGAGFDDSPLVDASVSCPITDFDKGYQISFFFVFDWTFKYHL